MSNLLLSLIMALGGFLVPRVSPIPFDDLVMLSDFVVRGRVTDVRRIRPDGTLVGEKEDAGWPFLQISAITVDDVLRGPKDLATVWIHAQGTWASDVTSADLGEDAVWFLVTRTDELSFGMQYKVNNDFVPASPGPKVHATLKRVTNGNVVSRITHSGRGKMPILKREEELWIKAWDEVLPPVEGDYHDEAFEGEYKSIYWSAKLVEVENWIRHALDRRRWPMPLDPRTKAPASEAVIVEGKIIFAAWEDGTVVWSADELLGGPPFWMAQLGLENQRADLLSSLAQEEHLDEFASALASGARECDSSNAIIIRSFPVLLCLPEAGIGDSSFGALAIHVRRRLLAWKPGVNSKLTTVPILEFEVFPSLIR